MNAGYGIESVVRAAAEQMLRLPYATGYFSYGSEPAIRLAARLAELAPPGLTRRSSRSAARTRWTARCG